MRGLRHPPLPVEASRRDRRRRVDWRLALYGLLAPGTALAQTAPGEGDHLMGLSILLGVALVAVLGWSRWSIRRLQNQLADRDRKIRDLHEAAESDMPDVTQRLEERIRELTTLYSLTDALNSPELNTAEALMHATEMLPDAWQYSEDACARIIWGDETFESFEFVETEWRLGADIRIDDRSVGAVEVYYRNPHPEAAIGPFIAEERVLLNELGIQLGDFLRRKGAEDEMRAQAQHDGLTGLPNRTLLESLGERAVSATSRSPGTLAVLFIDLDGFKQINDVLGHAAGDHLLIGVARRIRAATRDSDIVARLGGDEFAVILTHLTTAADAMQVAEKIRASIDDPFTLTEGEGRVSASIGVATLPEHGTTLPTLLKAADGAMYAAKSDGKDAIRLATARVTATSAAD